MGNFCTVFTDIQAETRTDAIKEKVRETVYLNKYELFNQNQIGKGKIYLVVLHILNLIKKHFCNKSNHEKIRQPPLSHSIF